MSGAISVRQTNSTARTNPHAVSNPVISPLSSGDFLQQLQITASIREFLFEVRKDGAIYWVGVAVPDGATDFGKAQVFFHPTVINGGVVHAADKDYPTFSGGWSRSLQRYVAMQGGQLAAARKTPLVVPFMTMAANAGKSPAYMFATRPLETLQAVMSAAQKVVTGGSSPTPLAQIGVSSFSSGVGAMRLFIKSFASSGLIVETVDLDGPFIRNSPRTITTAPGAVGRVISQVSPPSPLSGWTTLHGWKFKNVAAFRKKGVHAQIGWMTFFLFALTSVIK